MPSMEVKMIMSGSSLAVIMLSGKAFMGPAYLNISRITTIYEATVFPWGSHLYRSRKIKLGTSINV